MIKCMSDDFNTVFFVCETFIILTMWLYVQVDMSLKEVTP